MANFFQTLGKNIQKGWKDLCKNVEKVSKNVVDNLDTILPAVVDIGIAGASLASGDVSQTGKIGSSLTTVIKNISGVKANNAAQNVTSASSALNTVMNSKLSSFEITRMLENTIRG